MRSLIVVTAVALSGCSLLLSSSKGENEMEPDDCGSSWAHAAGSIAGNPDRARAVAVDGCDVVVCGTFQGNSTFDPSSVDFGLRAKGGEDIFVARFDAAGQVVWTTAIGGGQTDTCDAIAVADDGHVIIAGQFSDTVEFMATATLTSLGFNDAYVAELDGDGNVVWAHQFASDDVDGAEAVALTDSGDVIVGGFMRGSVIVLDGQTFDDGARDGAFFAVLDRSGAFLRGRTLGGGDGSIRAIEVAGNGDLVLAGDVSDDPALGGASDCAIDVNNLNPDAFVARFDPDANSCEWARLISGGDTETLAGLAITDGGSIIAVGASSSAVLTLNDDITATGNGSFDAFIVEITGNGIEVAAELLGGGGDDRFVGVAIEPDGRQVFFGDITGPFDEFLGVPVDVFPGDVDLVVMTREPAVIGVTIIGGGGNDEAGGLAIAGGRAIIAAGIESSFDFVDEPVSLLDSSVDLFVGALELDR